MFKTRLISGIVLVALAIVTFVLGGPLLLFINMLLGICAMYELYKALDMEKSELAIACYIAAGVYYLVLFGNSLGIFVIPTLLIIILTLLITFIIYVINYPTIEVINVMKAYFVFIYGGILISYLYQLRTLYMGNWLIWLIILSSWGCDTAAYCAGMKFGKKKLCPKLSPKKSVEGAIGGVIGAGLLGLIYAIVMTLVTGEPAIIVLKFTVICMIASIFSQFGDLFASGIKREHGVKDYGTLIPGHGGIMDRFDSVIFVAPIIYYLCAYIMC